MKIKSLKLTPQENEDLKSSCIDYLKSNTGRMGAGDGYSDDKVHCWMQYVNQAGDSVSTSSYLGEVDVL